MPFPYVFEMREMKKKRPPSSLVYSQARAKRRGERSVFLCVFFTTSLSLAASGPLAFVEVNTVVFGCEAYRRLAACSCLLNLYMPNIVGRNVNLFNMCSL